MQCSPLALCVCQQENPKNIFAEEKYQKNKREREKGERKLGGGDGYSGGLGVSSSDAGFCSSALLSSVSAVSIFGSGTFDSSVGASA